jgi:phage tail protein X
MKTIIAQAGDRLDQIVNREYGTQEVFTKVFEANPQLATKPILDDGDIVNIPIVNIEQIPQNEAKTLW